MPYLHQSKFSEPQSLASASKRSRGKPAGNASGPSLYEMSYFEDLAKELNTFLHSKGFSTVEEIRVGISGAGYHGYIKLAR